MTTKKIYDAYKKIVKADKRAIKESLLLEDNPEVYPKLEKIVERKLPLYKENKKKQFAFFVRFTKAMDAYNTGVYGSNGGGWEYFKEDLTGTIQQKENKLALIEKVLFGVCRPVQEDYKWTDAYTPETEPNKVKKMKLNEWKFDYGFNTDVKTEAPKKSKNGLDWQKLYESSPYGSTENWVNWAGKKKQIYYTSSGLVKWSHNPDVPMGTQLSAQDIYKLNDMGYSMILTK
ncbi:MAG: hypothetical protein ACOWWR_13620 [Eubacteriales bacterium]